MKTSTQKIKIADLLSAYCEATGYFPDECAGATDEELRGELLSLGYDVEDLPEKAKKEPWESPAIDPEAEKMAPGFWA